MCQGYEVRNIHCSGIMLEDICESLSRRDYLPVLVGVSIAAMKHNDQKARWVYGAYIFTSQFIIKGNQEKNTNKAADWKQELMQRTRNCAVYLWLAQPPFL